MLVSLHVKNLALMEEAEVTFGDGLNILSGETGAGKSIIIGSINLALGEKVPKEMLREHAEYALVELIFKVENEEQLQQLKEMDIYPEDNEVIMSRRITASRSVGKINSETVPASCMKRVASLLIDIHGQHEHQSLLHKRKHLEILDEYAKDKLSGKKKTLKKCYQEYQALQQEYVQALQDGEGRERELSFLEFEIQEIEEAQLVSGEDEELEISYRKMANSRRIMEAIGSAYEMTGGDGSATEQIGRALREMQSVTDYDPQLQVLSEQLEEVDNLVNHLKDKFGGSIEAVLQAKEEKEIRCQHLLDYEEYLQQLKQRMVQTEAELQKICSEVSALRQKSAKKLTKQVQKALVDLNFLDVNFTMEFADTGKYTANGRDEAEFLISTNPGEPLKPLSKVASGGEMSRIMLAIKTILAESDQIETLIFDEIDAGISGRTAQMVAEKMNVIGKNHQVICITHLPQIAAMADNHFLISKNVVNNATFSNIVLLEEKESITELARMLGGVKITDTVLESAKEMKELAISVKKQ